MRHFLASGTVTPLALSVSESPPAAPLVAPPRGTQPRLAGGLGTTPGTVDVAPVHALGISLLVVEQGERKMRGETGSVLAPERHLDLVSSLGLQGQDHLFFQELQLLGGIDQWALPLIEWVV